MFKHGSLALFLAVAPAAASAQTLSLNEAVTLALTNNTSLANAALEVDKAETDIGTARSRRFPSFKIETQASQLLRPVELTFLRGAFGDIPGVGPVPSEDAIIRTPSRLNFVVSAEAQQPLTQLHKLNLNVRLSEVARDYEREQLRDSRLALVGEIKRAYFAIARTSSALDANLHTLTLLHELNRVVSTRVVQQVALKADGLDVERRIAETDLARVKLRHAIDSQKEQLNQLMGRDLRTPFEVAEVPEETIEEIDLAMAQGVALDARSDVKKAQIQVRQAELARRVAKADYLPEVGVKVSYLSPINIDGAPRQIATAALQAQWEPFDWGRKGRALAAKDLEIRQARNQVRETRDRAVLEINSRFRQLEEARAQLRAVRLGQQTAREITRMRTTQYSVQAALLSDVLQAQSSLADSDSKYQEALVAFWTARADFERALGEDIIQ